MEGGRGAVCSNHGHKKEGTWDRTSFHSDKHGQLGFNILEPGMMEGGRGAGGQVMDKRKRVLGAEHTDTLTSITNLASTYRNQGQWKHPDKNPGLGATSEFVSPIHESKKVDGQISL